MFGEADTSVAAFSFLCLMYSLTDNLRTIFGIMAAGGDGLLLSLGSGGGPIAVGLLTRLVGLSRVATTVNGIGLLT